MPDEISDVIANNKGLVFAQLRKFGLSKDHEAESLGYEALFMAASTYENEKGVKFSTYATVCIYNALGSYVRSLNKQRQLDVVSYHELLHNSEGDMAEKLSFIACEQDTERDFLRSEHCRFVRQEFDAQVATMTNAKRVRILEVWRDNDFDITASDIAKQVGVSQSYVSQVLSSFKHAMRERLGGVR